MSTIHDHILQVRELTGDQQLTKEQISRTQLIVTTPFNNTTGVYTKAGEASGFPTYQREGGKPWSHRIAEISRVSDAISRF